jgi:hypothetical protein
VVVEGLNISELRLITGPLGADDAMEGADVAMEGGADSALALQPARPPAVMNSAAAPRTSLRRAG